MSDTPRALTTRKREAASSNGELYTPGIHRQEYTELIMCPQALNTPTTTESGRAAIRSQRAPRKARGERAKSKPIPAISRPSQTTKVNVGSGRKGRRARMANAVGLYVERKSCVASSVTCAASAAATPSHA